MQFFAYEHIVIIHNIVAYRMLYADLVEFVQQASWRSLCQCRSVFLNDTVWNCVLVGVARGQLESYPLCQFQRITCGRTPASTAARRPAAA